MIIKPILCPQSIESYSLLIMVGFNFHVDCPNEANAKELLNIILGYLIMWQSQHFIKDTL